MSRACPRSAVVGLALLLGLVSSGCRRVPSSVDETIVDLVEHSSGAPLHRELELLDLGTPAARPFLRLGWSADEASPGGRTFVWSDGPVSVLEFFLVEPRPVTVRLRGVPYSGPGSERQQISVAVNGRDVGRGELEPGGGELSIAVDAGPLVSGVNRLALTYASVVRPAELGDADDSRLLGVAWDSVRFDLGGANTEAVATRGDRLLLPWGSAIDYFLELPPASRFIAEGVEGVGADGRLHVTLWTDDGIALEQDLEPDSGRIDLPLTEEVERLVRLSFTAHPDTPGAAGTLAIAAPKIVAPQVVTRKAAMDRQDRVTPPKTEGPSGERATRPNILVYLVDTLRADHLGCYGYDRPVSPHLDAFAKDATLFENAVAQSSWTRSSVASLFTGMWPVAHGTNGRRDRLPQEALTLAEILREAGYRTAGFVANGNVARRFGLAQGFEDYELTPKGQSGSRDLNERVRRWLDGQSSVVAAESAAPFFLYVHTVDPHGPYDPPEEYRRQFAAEVTEPARTTRRFLLRLAGQQIPVTDGMVEDLLDLYDAEIAANDASFGELLAILDQAGVSEETIIVFVSDHGEEFHEHQRWQHGKTLYTEVLDIPLVIRFPDRGRGLRVPRVVQHTDILPTLLAYLELSVPPEARGRNLLEVVDGEGRSPAAMMDDASYSYIALDGFVAAGVTALDWRLVDPRSARLGTATQLYDHRQDPGEMRSVASEMPVTAGYLESLLRAKENGDPEQFAPGKAQIDGALRERLRGMGYLE